MATLGFGNTGTAQRLRKEQDVRNTVSAATAGRSMAPVGGFGSGAPIQQPKPDLATTVRAATAGRSMAPQQPDLATTVRAATAGRSMAPSQPRTRRVVRGA